MHEPLSGPIVPLAFTVRERNVAQDTEAVNDHTLAYRPSNPSRDLPEPPPRSPQAELDLDRLIWDQEYRDEMRSHLKQAGG